MRSFISLFYMTGSTFSLVMRPMAVQRQQRRVLSALTSNEELAESVKGKAILAPLTRGGTPPFRALCTAYGAEVTMGEMAFARMVAGKKRPEMARLRRHPSEPLFGAQIATNDIAEGVEACKIAAEQGVDWVDLNCGCPIYEATRRGLGSALLRNPNKLKRLVEGLIEGSPVPVSVKIRMSPAGESDLNFRKIILNFALLDDPPAFVSLHGRTTNARYRTAANWTAIQEAASMDQRIPVVGNGDITTHFEARMHLETAPNAHAFMIGRGALITPWIFQELKTGQTWLPTPAERTAEYWRLATLFKQHFGDDERGHKSANYFWPWHFDFLSRWRPLPEEYFKDIAAKHPLVQSSRDVNEMLFSLEGPQEKLDPLEQLLRCPVPEAHAHIADALWDAQSSDDAVNKLTKLATSDNLERWGQLALDQVQGSHDESEGQKSPQKRATRSSKKNKAREISMKNITMSK